MAKLLTAGVVVEAVWPPFPSPSFQMWELLICFSVLCVVFPNGLLLPNVPRDYNLEKPKRGKNIMITLFTKILQDSVRHVEDLISTSVLYSKQIYLGASKQIYLGASNSMPQISILLLASVHEK